jgi:hypothetical protein
MASRDSTIKSDVPGNVGSIKTWVPIWRSMTWTLAFHHQKCGVSTGTPGSWKTVFFVLKHPSVLGGNVNYFVHLLTRNSPFGNLVWVFLCFCFKAITTKWKVSWCWDHRTITVDFFKISPTGPCWSLESSRYFLVESVIQKSLVYFSIPWFFETEIRMGWIPMLNHSQYMNHMLINYVTMFAQWRAPLKLFRPWTRVENLFWWWMWTRSESTWPWPPWPRWGLACDFPVFSCSEKGFCRFVLDKNNWVNYNDLTATSLEIMVSKGNHPQMALIQVSELL